MLAPAGGTDRSRQTGYGGTVRYVELLRHTDNDGDRLTEDGVSAAELIGRTKLHPPYAAFVSSGADRATEMLEIMRRAVGQEDIEITVAPGLRSSVEDRWRAAAESAGKGADVEAMRAVDPNLVESESRLLGGVLRQVLDALPDGGRALAVGHSPTNEAAVLGLAAEVIAPMGKGEGVLVVEEAGRYEARPLT
jgi:phosphohistidine phosphatase SixA